MQKRPTRLFLANELDSCWKRILERYRRPDLDFSVRCPICMYLCDLYYIRSHIYSTAGY